MQKNELYPVICEDITNQGYGIVHIDAMTVFVFGLLPGEKAKIRILKVLSRYAFGKIEERYTSSAHRQEPVCPAFGKCGGCAFLHMEYSASLKVKQDCLIAPICTSTWHFRFFRKIPMPIEIRLSFLCKSKRERSRWGFTVPILTM